MLTSTEQEGRSLLPVTEVREKRSPISRMKEFCRRASKSVKSRFVNCVGKKQSTASTTNTGVVLQQTHSSIQMEGRDEDPIQFGPGEERRMGESTAIVDFSGLNDIGAVDCVSIWNTDITSHCFGSKLQQIGSSTFDDISLELERMLLGSESMSTSESEDTPSSSSSHSFTGINKDLNRELRSFYSFHGVSISRGSFNPDFGISNGSHNESTFKEQEAEQQTITSQLYSDLLFSFSLKSEQHQEDSDELILLNSLLSMITWSGDDLDLNQGTSGPLYDRTLLKSLESRNSSGKHKLAIICKNSMLARIQTNRPIRSAKKIGRKVLARLPGAVDEDDAYQKLLPS